MITIGLAGHIDHGKSSLVRRLTGVDPDRLPEEKERGMTIDLGFAHWTPTDGTNGSDSAVEVSFVDVPGHERFVRNMIAGAGGIEAVMLVVAADDGWMPQSQEHFDIIRLLNIQHGLVVVTKTDLAEPAWRSAVIDDIRERLVGSFLENAPIVSVSSTTGTGFPELEKTLKEISSKFEATQDGHHDIGKSRLTVDRSFVLPGIGGIVTGSARGGGFSVGDEIVIAPTGTVGKIRALHRHEKQVETVSAGQRAAISFTGIEREELLRGAFVTTPELGAPSLNGRVLLVRVEALPECPVKLTHRRKLLLFFGASEIPCEIRLPGAQELRAGETACLALRCDEMPFCFAGDRFVLRLPTPQVTVGGGVVLDWSANLPFKDELKRQIQLAEELFAGDKHSTDKHTFESLLSNLLTLQLRLRFPQAKENILLRSVFSQKDIRSAADVLIKAGIITEHDSLLFPLAELDDLVTQLITNIEQRFNDAPHLKGLNEQEVLRLLPKTFAESITDGTALLKLITKRKQLLTEKGLYRLPGRELSVSGSVRKEAERILSELKANPYSPPLIAKLITNGKVSKDALGFLFNTNEAVKVTSELALNSSSWREALKSIRQCLESGEELTVAWLRSELDTSRKYALPILEELDRLMVTERVDDKRVAGGKFKAFFEELDN